MGKIIINNKSKAGDAAACQIVSSIISDGRVSNYGKQYCYLTSAKVGNRRIVIASDLNAHSDKFTVLDDRHNYDNG